MLVIKGDRKIPMKKNRMRIKGNYVYKHKDVREFEMWLSYLASVAMKKQNWVKTDGFVSMHIDVVFGDKRRRDLQNCFGAVCDSLNEVVYVDDCQIVKLSATKRYVKSEWSFIIKIELCHDVA
jgi:Holliday junction resolvase RusA-like endonuclease